MTKKVKEDIKRNERKTLAKAIGIIMVILAASLFLFVFLVSTIRDSRSDAVQESKHLAFERLYSEMQILRAQAYDNCKRIRDDIETDLRAMDLEELKSVMDSGEISKEMYDIIDKHTKGISLNEIHNYKNGVIVMTQNGVLEDFNYERAADSRNSGIRTWEDEIDKAWNKDLERDAINKILNHDTEQPIATEKVEMENDENHIKITSMDKYELRNVFMNEGIEGLKNYQFKVTCYITDTGDIFGQEDIVHGTRQQTHKMNIVYILGILFISSVIILLFYFSHMYNYYLYKYNSDKDGYIKDEDRDKIINGKM